MASAKFSKSFTIGAEPGVRLSNLRTLAALPRCRALANHAELAKVLARMACATATLTVAPCRERLGYLPPFTGGYLGADYTVTL
jgi:hypothetical protein